MKCTICGTELEPNAQVCSNCGTRVIEMPVSARNSSSGGRYSSGGFGSARNSLDQDLFRSGKSAVRKKSNPTAAIVLLIIILLFAGGFFYYKYYATRTFKLEDFSIKMPATMSKDKESGQNSFDISSMEGNAASYSNSQIEFAYVEMDYSSVASEEVVSLVSEGSILTFLDAQFTETGSLDGYSKISLSGNTLKFYGKSKYGTDEYAVIKCQRKGTSFYILLFCCDKSDRTEYEAKFDKWLGTVSFN